MLYIWPFFAFFSAPLLIPCAISTIQVILQTVQWASDAQSRSSSSKSNAYRFIFYTLFALTALSVTLLIVKYNTIIHPFTLADNRHYVFYIFRYTILRHRYIRYVLAPIYLACAYLTLLCLAGGGPSPLSFRQLPPKDKPTPSKDRKRRVTFCMEGTSPTPKTSFAIILLVSTALSLITAPLVEPRYFIIPWVMWRLHVPSPAPIPPNTPTQNGTVQGLLGNLDRAIGGLRDMVQKNRLLLETVWFLLINVVTGYVFLYRGFEWPQEKGNVQRFMW